MARVLPILLMQSLSPTSANWAAEFERGLRRQMALFPRTQLVIYPELHLCPSDTPDGMQAQAEEAGGPREVFLQQLAADLKIWLVPGSVHERDAAGRIFNTALAISPAGEVVGRYRKCFPWRPLETVTPGVDFVVFDIPGLTRVGISICYDTWFPEVARHLAWMGAEVILQPTLTTTVDRVQEVILSQATAIMNQVFVVSVNAAAPQATGQSLVVDPEGAVVARAGEGPVAATHVLTLDHVTTVREYGTAGMTRVWNQFNAGDAPVPLPLYGGELTPSRWSPQQLPIPHLGDQNADRARPSGADQ